MEKQLEDKALYFIRPLRQEEWRVARYKSVRDRFQTVDLAGIPTDSIESKNCEIGEQILRKTTRKKVKK